MNGKKNNHLFRRSSSAHIHTNPQSEQNNSLTHPAKTAFNFAIQTISRDPQLHFPRGATTSEKASVVAGNVRTVTETAHKQALVGLKITRAMNKLTRNSWSLPNAAFEKSYWGLRGVSAVTEGLSFLKTTGSNTWQAIKDARAHNQRAETQRLLKDYDPITQVTAGNTENLKKLKEFLTKDQSDLARSQSQVAIDHLNKTKDLLVKGTNVVESSLLFARGFTNTVAHAIPVAGIAEAVLRTVNSAVKTGTQMVALNNLAKAKAATNDPLLQALAGHIKQERTILARKYLLSTAIGAISTGANIGLAASGVGAPAALIAGYAIGSATSMGTMAFDMYHNRKLAKARENSDTLMIAQTSLSSLATDNIGVAEKAFLMRLRSAKGDDLTESIRFLSDFGITDNTIKKLQLAPEEKAIKTLRTVLYSDKVKFKGLQLKQTAKTLAHIVGLTALGKRIKASSLWLTAKLRPKQNQLDYKNSPDFKNNIPYAYGLIFDLNGITKHESRIKQQKRQLRYRPAYPTIPNHFRYGRIVS